MPDLDPTQVLPVKCLAQFGAAGLGRYPLLVLGRLFCGLQYQGLYALPLLAALAGPALGALRTRPRVARLAAGAVVLATLVVLSAVAAPLLALGRTMPYLNQSLNVCAYGTDGYWLRGAGPRVLGRAGQLGLTAAAVPGAVLFLFVALDRALRPRRPKAAARGGGGALEAGEQAALTFIAGQWLVQFAFIAAVYSAPFERYYLLLLPLAFMVTARVLTSRNGGEPRVACAVSGVSSSATRSVTHSLRPAAVLAFAGLAALSYGFSLANLHDFFALHRAVAASVADLRARGIPPDRFDAGCAWMGWFYPLPLRDAAPEHRNSGAIGYLAKTFPLVMDDYVVTLSPEPDRSVVARRTYQAWLPLPGGEWPVWILGPRQAGARAGRAPGEEEWSVSLLSGDGRGGGRRGD
jgi:hypothetical protein